MNKRKLNAKLWVMAKEIEKRDQVIKRQQQLIKLLTQINQHKPQLNLN